MLTLFMETNCSSSREARMWLDGFSISYKMKSIRNMTREELVKILSLTENGLKIFLLEVIQHGRNTFVLLFIENLLMKRLIF